MDTAAVEEVVSASPWSRLNWDLKELVLSYLPLRSLARARAVCRLFHSVISHPSFPAAFHHHRRRRRCRPWLFIHGLNHVLPRRNQSFAFDFDSSLWLPLPLPTTPADENSLAADLLPGFGGYVFASSPSYTLLLYSHLLSTSSWCFAPPLLSPRSNPLVAVVGNSRSPKFLALGGVRYVGGLVDIEADRLAMELYDPSSPAANWQPWPPLPPEFHSSNSSQSLSVALVTLDDDTQTLYIAGIYSGIVACLGISTRVWGPVRALRPPGVTLSFLLSAGDRLLLAGLRYKAELVVWEVDRFSMNCREVAAMPSELVTALFDGENEIGGGGDDNTRFARLRCVGLDEVVYFVNEDPHKDYPVCMCEIVGGGECRWTKLPPLPGPVNRFHKVVAFCSHVPLTSVLGGGDQNTNMMATH